MSRKENKYIGKIKRIKPIPFLFHIISPSFGRCKKCGLPWNFCNEKTVYNQNGDTGIFATCDYCWEHSKLDELKQIYLKTYNNRGWFIDHYRNNTDITESVEREYYKNFSESELLAIKRKEKILKIKEKICSKKVISSE